MSLRPASPDFRHTLSLHLRNSMFSRFPEGPSQGCRSPSKAGAKIRPFFKLPNFFSNYFSGLPTNGLSDSGLHRKKIFVGARKRPGKSRKKEKSTAFFTVFGVFVYDKKLCVCVFCCFSGVYNKFVIHALRRIVFHLFVAQCFTKTVNKGYSPIFLSTVPSAQLFISCPTLSCRPFPVNEALPCPLFHAKAKNTDSFYLLFIIEDSILLTKYKYGGFYKFHIKITIINVR